MPFMKPYLRHQWLLPAGAGTARRAAPSGVQCRQGSLSDPVLAEALRKLHS